MHSLKSPMVLRDNAVYTSNSNWLLVLPKTRKRRGNEHKSQFLEHRCQARRQ